MTTSIFTPSAAAREADGVCHDEDTRATMREMCLALDLTGRVELMLAARDSPARQEAGREL